MLAQHQMHPIFLHFNAEIEERAYQEYRLPMVSKEARAGLLVAILCWFCYVLVEPMLLPSNLLMTAMTFSAIAIGVGFLVYSLTFTRFFVQYQQPILLLSGTTAMTVLSLKMFIQPEFAIAHLFPAVMLVTIWNFILSGLRFVYAFAVGIVFVLVFIAWFLMAQHVPNNILINNSFYAITALALGAMTSYMYEKQNRQLFVQKQMLDAERERHLHRALHDSLTQLPNRDLLEDRLEQAINLSGRADIVSAGIYIDLDNFKPINDLHGHVIGDLYLKEVAMRLRDITRETDTISRLSGDEFFLLVPDIKNDETALKLAQKLQVNLANPFILKDKVTLPGITVSIGICMFPYKHCTALDIINRADKAMYVVKHQSKNNVSFA